MVVRINGEEREVGQGMSVLELLSHLGVAYKDVGLAVSINGEVILKKDYQSKYIQEGDSVEVIHLVGGG
ncbi:MAG: sulfur carrier protein ThiS [Aquificaceae bacterium]